MGFDIVAWMVLYTVQERYQTAQCNTLECDILSQHPITPLTSLTLMTSSLLRHSFLLSSTTVSILVIHRVSTGPSNIIWERCISVGRGVLPISFWRGQSPLNILGLILRCLVNYKLLPKVLKGFVLCQPPQYLCLSYIYCRLE